MAVVIRPGLGQCLDGSSNTGARTVGQSWWQKLRLGLELEQWLLGILSGNGCMARATTTRMLEK